MQFRFLPRMNIPIHTAGHEDEASLCCALVEL